MATDAASFAANPDLLVSAQPGTTPFYTAVYEVLEVDAAMREVLLQPRPAATRLNLRVALSFTDARGRSWERDRQGRLRLLIPYGAGVDVVSHDVAQLLG